MPSKPTIVNPRGEYPLSSFKDEPLMQLRTLYNAFVKGLFSAAPRGSYHWCQGEGSEIYISDEHPVKSAVIGKRPAVSFTRSAVQFYSLGNDDMLDYKFESGRKTKGVLIPGTMSINCSSRVDIESERIAWIIAEHLWMLRERLMGLDLFFEIGRQAQISPPTPAEGVVVMDAGDEWYCTTVTSPFQFPRTSQVTPLNRQIVQGIELQIRTQLMQLRALNSGGPTTSPNSADFGISTCEQGPPAFFPAASDAYGRTPDPGGRLPPPPRYAAHPLDPSRTVVVRTIHPFRPGLRPPSMGGRAIPIAQSCVEESDSTPPIKLKV
jgi:hypothetical protein